MNEKLVHILVKQNEIINMSFTTIRRNIQFALFVNLMNWLKRRGLNAKHFKRKSVYLRLSERGSFSIFGVEDTISILLEAAK
jgi:hypothetical protein